MPPSFILAFATPTKTTTVSRCDSHCDGAAERIKSAPRLLIGLLALQGLQLLVGCEASDLDPSPATIVSESPEKEFAWGMERLNRALHFRPSGTSGLSITDRQVSHELLAPDQQNPNYRARVIITTKTAYLHDKRQSPQKKLAKKKENAPIIDDPLADPEDELAKVLEIPGTGPQTEGALSARIEPRSTVSETVFELVYREGKWQLTEQPEKTHEQLWFEYAFD